MKLNFVALGCVPVETATANDAHAKSLGLPFIAPAEAHSRPLAVVGGGQSILDRVDEIRQFDEVWAINGAWQWCQDRGIEATFFSVDPQPALVDLCRSAKRAILATQCDPSVFEALKGADVRLVGIAPCGPIGTGPTTVTAVPLMSAIMGYSNVVLFGCEGSYVGPMHAYGNETSLFTLEVECGGQRFITEASYLMQCDFLSAIIKAVPTISERSGGLLAAVIEHGEHDITAASRHIMDNLRSAA